MGPEPGPLARVMGVFFSPGKTFESIARKPGWDWLVPVVLVMAASFVAQSVLLPKMDVDDAVKTQMKIVDKMSKGSIPEEKRAEIEQRTRQGIEAGKTPVRRALNTLFVPCIILLVALIYHGIAAAFGTKTSYLKVLSGYAYTWVIYIVPTLLAAAVAWPSEKLDVNDIQFMRVLKSNAGAFLDFDTTSKAVLAVASSVDVFDFWGFFVGSIALSKTTKFSPRAAMGVVGGVWLTYILLKVALGGVYSAFLG
jgi:Yip1 domain